MRLGAPVFNFTNAAEWAAAHVNKGLGAAYWPLPDSATPDERDAYVRAAADHDIVIAEVGIWNNMLHPDPAQREANIQTSIARLRTADAVGARCCVNIAGTRKAASWDGPHVDNFSEETFDLIVATTRRIITEAAPERTSFTLECMPWMVPYDECSMRRLIAAVDHPRFGVHIDMCNLMNSPVKVFRNAEITCEWFAAFGSLIRCIHAKDVVLHPHLTTHIDEALPGRGMFDFAQLLRCANDLAADVPVMCEHLPDEASYDEVTNYLSSLAKSLAIPFK